MKMDIGSSQSWWWESHNRPKHSKWLQENLADVEANVQSMLTLIEGDADSFAQRAEMYYKKRPDLLKVVEQFYRGYRALAERYDQLSGSVRQVPTALQHQYGLVSESPRASPFRQMAFVKANSTSTVKDATNESAIESGEFSGPEGEGESLDASSLDEKSVEQGLDCDESSSSSSDVEFDSASLEIQRLHKTVEKLQADNKRLTDKSREKMQQYRETEKRLHGFREDFLRAQKESNTLRAELQASEKLKKRLEEENRGIRLENETLRGEVASSNKKLEEELETAGLLREENTTLVAKQKELVAALRFMKGAAVTLLRRNRSLLEQVSSLTEDRKASEKTLAAKDVEVTSLLGEVEKLGCALEESQETVASLNVKVGEQNQEVTSLQEDNDRQRVAVAECAEEKREVIRQLCYTIDLMNERNQWLESILVSAKSKMSEYHKLVAAKKSGWSIF